MSKKIYGKAIINNEEMEELTENENILLEYFKDKPQETFNKLIELSNQQLISGYNIYELQTLLNKKCGINVNANNLNYKFY